MTPREAAEAMREKAAEAVESIAPKKDRPISAVAMRYLATYVTVDRAATLVRALPLPEPTPDRRDEALAKAQKVLSDCAIHLRAAEPFYGSDADMAHDCDEALTAINLALKGDET